MKSLQSSPSKSSAAAAAGSPKRLWPGRGDWRRLVRGEWRQGPIWGVTMGALMALVVLLLLAQRPIGGRLQYDTLDFWFYLREPALPRSVAILAVDESTVQRWGGRSFDGRDVARLLALLRQKNVRAAALAFPQLCTLETNESDEAALSRGLARSEIGVLPLHAREARTVAPAGHRHKVALGRFAVGSRIKNGELADGDALEAFNTLHIDRPGTALRSPSAGAGLLNFPLEGDGRVRELPLLVPYRGQWFPALPLAAYVKSRRLTPKQRSEIGFVNAKGERVVPALSEAVAVGKDTLAARHGSLLLNFPTAAPSQARRAGNLHQDPLAASPSSFHVVSVAAALDNPNLLTSLHGKCVVIGPTATSVTNFYQGPGARRLPATEIYAVALDNMLTGRALRRVPDWVIWLLTFGPCLVIGGTTTARRPTWSGLITVTSLLAIALISLGLFSRYVWLDISAPWLAGGLTYLIGVIGRARRQERDSTRVASTIEAISQVSEVIAAQTQPQELLSRVLDWSMDLLRANGSSALPLDDSGQTLRFAAATGPKGMDVLPFTLRLGEGIAGWVALHGEPAIVNDTASDTRFKRDIDREVKYETQSILCVPLRTRDKMLGVIEVINRADGHPFTWSDAEMLLAVANQAAVALDNARLYEVLNQRVEKSESALEITNRRLESERNLLSTVLESMTGGVIVTDGSGRVQLANPAAQRLLPELYQADGTPRNGEPLGQILPDFYLDTDSSSPRTLHAELKRGDPDAPRLILPQATPLLSTDRDGTPAGWIVVLDDVTEARHIERAKSDFVSFVAHEMRSPLTSVAGFASMLQRPEHWSNTASRARFLDIIRGESERLTRLINSLLDVARIEAGRPIELLPETVNLAEVAEAACESQRSYSSRHEIICNVSRTLPTVRADRDKLTQILINLLSNALKYSPNGLVTITARRAGEFVEVSVRDEGPGIPPEQRRLLFARFSRPSQPVAGAGALAKPTGTGLGLFLTKHLVEAHGGHIRASSGATGGAVFSFTLPVAVEEEKSETANNDTPPSS